MKKTLKQLLATSLAGCMLFSFVGCKPTGEGEKTTNGEYSYLAIDINPSMELIVDGETVVKVKACNEDAAILLSGETFEGRNVEVVSESIVELAEELGYLTEENDGVKITVSADSAKIEEKLEGLVQKGIEKASQLAKVNFTPRWADERKVKELQGADKDAYKKLTPAKLRLIEAIMLYDDTMTYEKGANMKVCELADMLEDYAEEYEDIVGEELEELFEQEFDRLKEARKASIAKYLSEDYQEAWKKYTNLKVVAKGIESKIKATSITPEDMQAILDLLDVQKLEGGNGAGNGYQHGKPAFPETIEGWNEEMVETYLDRHFCHRFDEDKFEEIEEAIEEILEKYDEDEYVLTEADLKAIQTAWGTTLDVKTFEDLDDFLEKEEERLEKWSKELYDKLDEEIKATIEFMESVNNIFADAREEVEKKVGEARKTWQQKKQERLQGAK